MFKNLNNDEMEKNNGIKFVQCSRRNWTVRSTKLRGKNHVTVFNAKKHNIRYKSQDKMDV